MARVWVSLNAKAELARMHRDSHCHETVVWYCPLEDVVACSPTVEESYRRATTQGPIIERGSTRISRAGIPKRPLPNCQAGPTASSTPLFQDAQMPWSGHPLLGRPADCLPSGTVGQWLPAPCNGGPSARAATLKPTRRKGG